jgi:predicted lipoprotein
MISWRKLNNDLSLKTEEQVLALLNEERATGKRVTVLERLHQRYNTLRVARERVELLKEATK